MRNTPPIAICSKQRLSNIELLRLICMLMVLNLHSFWGYDHGHESYIFQALDFFRESLCICAVDTFILISGYFGINWKFKSFWNLVFQVLFYSFAVYLVASILLGVIPFEKRELLKCVKGLSGAWGFITCYLTLYFFAPLLNAYVEKNTEKILLCFIVLFFIAEVFILRAHNGVMNFFLLYLIGRWIQKKGTVYFEGLRPGFWYFLISCCIFMLAYTVVLIFHYDAEKMCNFILAYSYASPFVILQSVFLFLWFSRLKVQNRFINWCATSCLSIFLIHMHPAIKDIGYYGYTESLYEKSILEHLLKLTLLICIVFWGAIFIDKIRIAISDFFYKILKKIKKTIEKRNWDKFLYVINWYEKS